MTRDEVLLALRALGDEKTKAMLMRNHGVKEPCYGVKIGDLKPLVKQLKHDHPLALALYDSGVYDAMYLAGLIADDAKMAKRDLQRWVKAAYGGSLPGTTVPSVAAGGPYGWDLALGWIDSPRDLIASAGWATLSCLVALKDDADLDLKAVRQLMQRAAKELPAAGDAARYQMNGFLIAAGCYVAPLTDEAIRLGEKLGRVEADLGKNACKVPPIADYIRKVQARGAVGKKRKTVKC